MKKWLEIEGTDNKFRDWSRERLWQHFIKHVVGLYYINCQEDFHTWLRMIHREDVIHGYHTITQSDGTIQAYRKNPKNDPKLSQEIVRRLQRQEDLKRDDSE